MCNSAGPLRRLTPAEIAEASRFDGEEFSIDGELMEERIPMLNFHGRIVGADAALLVDSVCRNFDDIAGDIILNLTECKFFSSVAIGFVVALALQRENMGGNLVIANATRQIQQVIGMMGMRGAFRFSETVEEAVKSCESGRWRKAK